MPGQLFSEYFLTEGITTTQEWQNSIAESQPFELFIEGAKRIYSEFQHHTNPNEATTEQDVIRPILELLGWQHYLPQQGAAGNEDVPDHLLFEDEQSRTIAAGRNTPAERFGDAIAIEESKRFGLALDSREVSAGSRSRTPRGQILRYLTTADVGSDGRIRWGILTNGAVWRLYDHRTRPRSTGFFEANLQELLAEDDDHELRTVYLFFRRSSFSPQAGNTVSFLETALEEGRRYEEQVAQDISSTVFEKVFPSLANALAAGPASDLNDVREASLIFLYRLLFVLYAEDRDLLPVNDPRYDDYGLRKRVRDDIHNRMSQQDTFSKAAPNYYNHLMVLFRLIDKGDLSIGLPPYNGGLFGSDAAPLLDEVSISDAKMAPIIYELSHVEMEDGRRFVNYRNMSVQQLGSIYERLLEREIAQLDNGTIVVRPNAAVRRDTGSYFTPQQLVDLAVERTLRPHIDERLEAFAHRARELSEDKRPIAEKLEDLYRLDPAEALLSLRVLDPAMGSGHFLVTAVDFLSDNISEWIEHASTVQKWLEDEYVSPVLAQIEDIRNAVLERTEEAKWTLDKAALTDETIIRRMVLKRCIYGVDKSPLTVELAKVSLWLHSFTAGAPLSFLDHHLRIGDSLVGLNIHEGREELTRLGTLFTNQAIGRAEAARDDMRRIEQISDAVLDEVEQSAELFRSVEETTSDLRGLLDFLCGLRWLTTGMGIRERARSERPMLRFLIQVPIDDVFLILSRGPDSSHEHLENFTEFTELWNKAMEAAEQVGFFHWEVAFPGVWTDWEAGRPAGGFDAVIGNPPWDRNKLQEIEWFKTRAPEIAGAHTAADRNEGIRHLRDEGDPLWEEYVQAGERANAMGQWANKSNHYPLLGGGDVNLYSLFVERAMNLIHPEGLVGLLTPSGIYGGKTAARFFRTIFNAGRVAGLFDFENRGVFFPDVHPSLKFCLLLFGGEQRKYDESDFAFFLHDTNEIRGPERCFTLSPQQIASLNPNTGTAPVFRLRRDVDLTVGIYERHPVLELNNPQGGQRAYDVDYRRMFDMTNHSYLFHTADALEEDGCYRVQGQKWRRGEQVYVPLYEGKMVQAYDHRAASVEVRPENQFRPAVPRSAKDENHADFDWLPTPQFWVNNNLIRWPDELEWTVGFKDATATTNSRTMIAAIIPRTAIGNTLPVLMPHPYHNDDTDADEYDLNTYRYEAPLLLGCLNSMPFDFAARQKVQGQHLNWYIVQQLPVIAVDDYNITFGDKSAADLITDHVLRLTYTSSDLAPFARDLGYEGPPFIWDREERRCLRARLDALYFHLYGIGRDDADYILSTFTNIRRQDETEFAGTYRTRDLVLGYMNAFSAGDTDTVIAL